MEPETIRLDGTVQSVIFRNDDNGYCVLRLKTEDGSFFATGFLPGIAPGELLDVTGKWVTHPSYGQQFSIDAARRSLPTDVYGIYDYLAGGAVGGVGPKTAGLIVEAFGERSIEVLSSHPDELAKIKGISARKAKEIAASFAQRAGLRQLMEYLASMGVDAYCAVKLYGEYGADARSALEENPYILADERFGGDFFQADGLARQLGFDGASPARLEAAVLFEMRHNLNNGHVFLPRGKLAAAVSRLIETEEGEAAAAISRLDDAGRIVCESVAGEEACYLPELYAAEVNVAERLRAMAGSRPSPVKDVTRIIERIQRSQNITYAPEQRRAVELAAENSIVVLTGGPGTGKTTCVLGILALFDSMGLETLLAAPTGRAAKRMSELTGRDAFTVHRLLGASRAPEGDGTVFSKNEEDPLRCGALVLDESSMADIVLTSALLDALPPNARLVLVGDADQLPSVGPGNVFADVIRSGAVPVVRLDRIFRQSENSGIVRSAHAINSGQMPEMKAGGDFFVLRRRGGEDIAQTVVELVAERLPANMGIKPDEIQVLSPTRVRAAGTADLNAALQEELNPSGEDTKEYVFGSAVFRVGDRVMQTRNNYEIAWFRYKTDPDTGERRMDEAGIGIFNGDVGYIQDIDKRAGLLQISFDGRVCAYSFELLRDLELAYAVTVHKSQGSEYRAVILSALRAAPALMTSSVLYTAVTRARELAIIVGDPEDIRAMVENDRRQKRYSGLNARL